MAGPSSEQADGDDAGTGTDAVAGRSGYGTAGPDPSTSGPEATTVEPDDGSAESAAGSAEPDGPDAAPGESARLPGVPQYRQFVYALGATSLCFYVYLTRFSSRDGGWVILASVGLFAVLLVTDAAVQWLRGRG